MEIKLIPLVEITHYSEAIKAPDKGPYWIYTEEWEQYHRQCQAKAGFPDPLPPYRKGSVFYRPEDITTGNLTRLVLDHTQDMRAGAYDREQACPLYGGYLLQVNGEDIFFPQCCSDLSDIGYYESLSRQETNTPYQGHPQPVATFEEHHILLDFSTGEYDESFVPPPPKKLVRLDIALLKMALGKARKEMEIFAARVETINQAEELHIAKIGNLLVWGEL